jgi:HD superfamily phosphodiesterase
LERPLSEQLTHEARDLVGLVLKDNPERLHHCAAVAARAQALAVTVPLWAADALVASAWLHDIGYGSAGRNIHMNKTTVQRLVFA